MTQPVRFSITADFSQDEANGVTGRSTVRTAALDALFSAVKDTTDDICDNLALIQRDDGALLDATVRLHTLSSDVLALIASTSFTVRGPWVGGTAYVKGDIVLQGGLVYLCIVSHTANVFATDLAAGDWGGLTTTSNASTTSFAPTSTIAAATVQAAIVELDNELRPSLSVINRDIYNGL